METPWATWRPCGWRMGVTGCGDDDLLKASVRVRPSAKGK